PSPAGPQPMPWSAQVLGVHGAVPQTLGVPPPPQDSLPMQVPQSRRPPQPSLMGPQFAPCCAHVVADEHMPSPPASTNVSVPVEPPPPIALPAAPPAPPVWPVPPTPVAPVPPAGFCFDPA